MSVALRGNLQDFGIAEVFQLIGHQAKTGVLEITNGKTTVRLRFDAGSVVDAAPAGRKEHAGLGDLLVRCGALTRERLDELARESEASATPLPTLVTARGILPEDDVRQLQTLLTQETIFRVLRWDKGSFHFHAQSVSHGRPSSELLGAEQILMDGLRMVDEWRTFLEQVPSEELVFRRTGPFEVHRSKCPPQAQHRLAAAERVFLLVDGRLPVRRVVDLSRLGTFEATRVLADLRRSGVLEPVDPKRLRRALPAAMAMPAERGQLRAWAASLAALALLGAAAFQTRAAPEAPAAEPGLLAGPAPAGFPLHDPAFARARARFAKRGLRNAAEAFRYARGRWPASLEELLRSEWAPPDADALAGARGEPYYYRRHEDGVLVLAPEGR